MPQGKLQQPAKMEHRLRAQVELKRPLVHELNDDVGEELVVDGHTSRDSSAATRFASS